MRPRPIILAIPNAAGRLLLGTALCGVMASGVRAQNAAGDAPLVIPMVSAEGQSEARAAGDWLCR